MQVVRTATQHERRSDADLHTIGAVATSAALLLRLERDGDGRILATVRLLGDLESTEPQLVWRVVGRDAVLEVVNGVIDGVRHPR